MTKRPSADRFRPSRRGVMPVSRQEGARIAGRSSLPVLLLAAAGALLLGWMVSRTSAVNALIEDGSDVAAAWSPNHPEIRLDQARDELQLTGDLSPRTMSAVFEAFRRAPLSDVPLLVGVRRANMSAQEDLGDRLLAMAARRNPRSRYTLLLELDRHVRRGRTEEAAETIGVLTRFFPEVSEFLVAELGRMAADPGSRAAVRHVMATDPQIRTSVLEQMSRDGANPDVILALAGPQPRIAAGAEAPRWQLLLLDGMVERGQAREALAIWSRLVGIDPEVRTGGLYDPGFAGLPGPPPFNWNLETGADGYAERDGSGGMLAQYYGRGNATLARQLLVLAPGAYRISFDVKGEADAEHGRLAWVLACHPGGQRLVDLQLTGIDFTGRQLSADFSIPDAGCASQWLRLVGTAAEFPEDQQVTVTGLQIAAGAP